MAEWWYNTTFHTFIQLTPFEALYGYPLPQLGIPQEPKAKDLDVAKFLADRKRVLQLIKDKLIYAKEMMKYFVGKKRIEREFQVGECIFLRLQPY